MAFIKFNKKETEKKANSFGAIADGEYELLVTKNEWRPMLDKPDKTPYFNVELTIRSDVDQEAAGRKIFHSFYISRDPEKAQGSLDFINRFNLALDLPDGMELDEEPWAKWTVGKPVRAKLKNETSEYNGKTYENVRVKYFMSSEYPDVEMEMDKPSGIQKVEKKQVNKIDDDPFINADVTGTIDISDDDLPF